jgi:hypothetical protein
MILPLERGNNRTLVLRVKEFLGSHNIFRSLLTGRRHREIPTQNRIRGGVSGRGLRPGPVEVCAPKPRTIVLGALNPQSHFCRVVKWQM